MRNVTLSICVLALGGSLAALGCRTSSSQGADTSRPTADCGADARNVVEELGHRLRLVSLLAPESLVTRSLRDAYAPVVTPQLLASWQRLPRQAPGREVSSPWPARIVVSSISPDGAACRVAGEVVYVTSADSTTVVDRRPVSLQVVRDSGWRVSGYEQGTAPAIGTADSTQPADVVRRYYAAIDARNFPAAYALWGADGGASGKSLAEFAAGFGNTTHTRVIVGDSIRMEGAAGSQYATVPVVVDATLRDGRQQHFTGTYIVRRAMVDGATPAQRRWHIYKADLRER
jgi:hypothetical protein